MAATDTLESAIAQLTPSDRNALAQYIAQIRGEMLTARSEDARMRLLEVFFRGTNEMLAKSRR